jgi:hypothetical protein
MVTPFELIVFVPVVAANVKVPAASGTVIPDVDNFKLPKIVITELFHVPPNPAEVVPSVKSKSRYEPAVRVSAAVLLVNLNEILLASVTAVGVIVLAVVVTVAVQIINGVPVTVMVVAPVKIVPVLFSEIVFVPKASVPVKPVQVRV